MSTTERELTSAEIRKRVGHPIIDSDGHYGEIAPLFAGYFLEHVEQAGGGRVKRNLEAHKDDLSGYLATQSRIRPAFMYQGWARMSPEERRDSWTPQPAWAPPHRSVLDRATSFLPKLLHQRMEEFGIDYTVLYPSFALSFPHVDDEELRRATCRALNAYNAEMYRDYADRITPAAVIPMFTPQEAIEELEHAVNVLGLKVAMIGHVVRPVPEVQRRCPEFALKALRVDAFALDSDYDYDPFWAKCAELRVPLASHQTAYGLGGRQSLTNYIYNQTGAFAEAGDLLCKALFLGGVTRRFPTLKFQFLECGVGWACVLFADLVARWGKRNVGAIEEYIRDARRGQGEFIELMERYAQGRLKERLASLRPVLSQRLGTEIKDDWAACHIERASDVRDLFIPRFFFSCEADDPVTAWAFNTKANPFGARLRATLGSDLGHWDVPDMRKIVTEAYELVEKGLITDDDFRAFAYTHPAEFYAGVNPKFFEGTKIEREVRGFLSQELTATSGSVSSKDGIR